MNALYHSSVCAIYAFPFLRVTFSECLLSLCQTQETNLDGHHENHSQLTGVCQNFLYNKIDPLGMPHTIRLATRDRKSTRLNSSHVSISYAVFCLKKKKEKHGTYNSPLSRYHLSRTRPLISHISRRTHDQP